MTFKIYPLRFPEMTIFVSEFKLHMINDVCKRELVGKSEFSFYHDEDEDLSKKLRLRVFDSEGRELFIKNFSHFSSFNASYPDDEIYLPEKNYVFEDISLEELYKNEDFSRTGIFNNLSQFSDQDNGEQGNGLHQSQEPDSPDPGRDLGEDFEMFEDSFNSSQHCKTEDGEMQYDDDDLDGQLLPASNSEDRTGPVTLDSSPDLVPASLDPGSDLGENNQFEDLMTMPLLYKY